VIRNAKPLAPKRHQVPPEYSDQAKATKGIKGVFMTVFDGVGYKLPENRKEHWSNLAKSVQWSRKQWASELKNGVPGVKKKNRKQGGGPPDFTMRDLRAVSGHEVCPTTSTRHAHTAAETSQYTAFWLALTLKYG
jgi:hypothetical protein